ncbi:MAG: N-acetylmuramoyl-L-alanine amidase [Spirochaetota bacterium]
MQIYHKLKKRLKLFLFVILILVISPTDINIAEFPEYRVVIDPGHGGFSLTPKKKHGDRYDSISKKYLSDYLAGTNYLNVEERFITYSIAKKVKTILDLTLHNGNFGKFKNILNKFTDDNPRRIIVKIKLSRPESLNYNGIKGEDPNSEYRLFDFYNKHGNKKYGRISIINSFKPHLVVSLHCDLQAPLYYRGINPVILAPFPVLNSGLNYLQNKGKDRKFFFNSPYGDWFTESVKRSGFEWFLKDVSVYFTSFPVDSNCNVEDKFMGYLYNMVNWQYSDFSGWEITAKRHRKNTQYSKEAKDFILQGKFWDREQSIYEKYRRDGGNEGFGGDNLYASAEIIRYILFSLFLSGNFYPGQKPGKPYISIWSLPILVNAITAYIELGYLKNERDRFTLTKKQDEIAEGIAVGVYSLFAGMKPCDKKFKYLPNGKKIELDKYNLPSGRSYFDVVVQ